MSKEEILEMPDFADEPIILYTVPFPASLKVKHKKHKENGAQKVAKMHGIVEKQEVAKMQEVANGLATEGAIKEDNLRKVRKPDWKAFQKTLTYGIELEFVFAFHQSLLNGIPVEKNIPYEIRNKSPFNKNGDLRYPRAYNSWGVYREGKLEPYGNEPLRILRETLPETLRKITSIVGDAGTRENKSNDRYKNWHISTDHSVRGVGSNNLVTRLSKLVQSEDKDSWDSYGLKVVSRVMHMDKKQDTKEIQEFVDALQFPVNPYDEAGTRLGAFVTNQAGMHVHVHVNFSKDSVAFLRELAFMLIVYEDQISRMHPPSRRPEHECSIQMFESNRANLPELAKETFGVDTENHNNFKEFLTLPRLRQLLANCTLPEHFLRLMGREKTKLVSWTNIVPMKNCPTTIEFRQHRGTLDKLEIQWWTFFVIGLMRLAYSYSKTDGCRVKGWDDAPNILDLLKDMHMPKEGVRFYIKKITSYSCIPKGYPLNASDRELPPGSEDTKKVDGLVIKPTTVVGEGRKANQKRPADDEPVGQPGQKKVTTTTGAKNTVNKPITITTISGKVIKFLDGNIFVPETTDPKTISNPGLQNPKPNTTPRSKKKNKRWQTAEEFFPNGQSIYDPIAQEKMYRVFGSLLFVADHDPSKWEKLKTGVSGPSGYRYLGNVCGIWAIIGSLKAQYPKDEIVESLGFHQVLDLVSPGYATKTLQKPAKKPSSDTTNTILHGGFQDDELARGVEALGNYKLVKCYRIGKDSDHATAKVAFRVTKDINDLGRNLYLDFMGNEKNIIAGEEIGHWSAMRRK